MSEPWIKVYPADMRADPKFDGLNADMQLALIHAWDLAKNGPGDMAELRSSEGRTMSERELRRIANVSGAATRRMFERWAKRGLCELDEEDGHTLVIFPNLAKRQGIDRTNAERQRRFRERQRNARRNARSNAVSNGPKLRPVTGQNQNQKENSVTPTDVVVTPPSTRKPDPIWDALLEACPAGSDMTKSERGRRNKAVAELREIDADPADVRIVARRLREKWGGRVALTPSAIVTNWAGTLAEVRPNGHRSKLTPADFDRMAEERDRITAERQAAAAAPDDEGVPY